MSVGFETWALGVEASTVIGMRLGRLAMLDADAMKESELMVREKVAALAQLQMKAMTGQLGASPQSAARKSVAHLRAAVRANRRRLGRKR